MYDIMAELIISVTFANNMLYHEQFLMYVPVMHASCNIYVTLSFPYVNMNKD